MVQALRSGMIRVNAVKMELIFSVNLITSFFCPKYEKSVPVNGSNERYTDKWLILLLTLLELAYPMILGLQRIWGHGMEEPLALL